MAAEFYINIGEEATWLKWTPYDLEVGIFTVDVNWLEI
jgi:hypothetical protein